MIPNCARSFGKKALTQKKALGLISVTGKKNYATGTTFETKPFRLHKLEQGPATSANLTKDDAILLYKQMQTIRRLETSSANLYKEKVVRGFCHLYSGQEAVAVGIKAVLRPHDVVVTAYRAHGWTYVMGASPSEILAELAGRRTGCARGKGGSMHMYTHNFYGGNGIVGSQVPLGVGLALAAKYRGTDGVSVVLYGDGAANQGQVAEVFNIAKLWSLPCIFVCENNHYGMGTRNERASANTAYYTRGDLIPGIWVDGMDVLSVREATRFALDHCVSGKGPILLEAATYRYYGHSMSDPGTSYRTRDEIQQVRQTRDPINSFKDKIIAANLVTADELTTIDAEIKSTVDDATKKAKSEKEVPLDELTTDIYSHDLEKQVRNVNPFAPLPHKRVGKAINFK